MDKKSALSKIRKCMALAESSNAHEAGIALTQAQALMEQFGIDDQALLAAEIEERGATATVNRAPAKWESGLASLVSRAFGCGLVFKGRHGRRGEWSFIGQPARAEIAAYAFSVLRRRAKVARLEFVKTHIAALRSRKVKVRRADRFCDYFVAGVAKETRAFAGNDQTAAIDAYVTLKYPDMRTLEAKDRNAGKRNGYAGTLAARAGYEAGSKVKLHQGLGDAAEKAAPLTAQLQLEAM